MGADESKPMVITGTSDHRSPAGRLLMLGSPRLLGPVAVTVAAALQYQRSDRSPSDGCPPPSTAGPRRLDPL